MSDRELTPLGQLLEGARERLQITGREAARRAGISESRWRQVVTGMRSAGVGVQVPVRPKARTVIVMAQALRVDIGEALAAAGLELAQDELGAIMADMADSRPRTDARVRVDLGRELDRVQRLNVPASVKIKLITGLIDLHDQAAAEAEIRASAE